MLGLAPDRRGLLLDLDVERLREFGEAIRQRFGDNLVVKHVRSATEQELAFDGNPDTFSSAPPGSHHATLEVNFVAPVTFNEAQTMEWLNTGQHVEAHIREFQLFHSK